MGEPAGLFLRFGAWHKSDQHIAAFRAASASGEQGYIYAPFGPAEEARDARYDNYLFWRKPGYLVTGEEIGHARDGAVLLRSVRIVQYILPVYLMPRTARPRLVAVPKAAWVSIHKVRGLYPHIGICISP